MPTSRDLEQSGIATREVPATFGRKEVKPDATWEWDFAAWLRDKQSLDELNALYGQHREGEGAFDYFMRRVLLRAMCKKAGHALQVGPGVVFKHPETMEFGDAIFIGAQAMIQGRYDGICKIGSHGWIGPQAYFDARNLVLEDYVGWGPGAKVLGSAHTGVPTEAPTITTPLVIKPVVVGFGADIGMNASILPGIRIGTQAIVGAGAVVTHDVPDFAVVAGSPARVIRDRREA
jgi:acetyltransferase-like isoleucine patch superfamily enzyme